jgi:hypothetical protein
MTLPGILTVLTVLAAAAAGLAYSKPALSIALLGVALAAFVAEELVKWRRRRSQS